jgi:hypothetical protein
VGESVIKPFHDLLELINSQLSAFISIIGGKCFVESELLRRKDLEQFNKTFFDFELQFSWDFLSVKAFLE